METEKKTEMETEMETKMETEMETEMETPRHHPAIIDRFPSPQPIGVTAGSRYSKTPEAAFTSADFSECIASLLLLNCFSIGTELAHITLFLIEEPATSPATQSRGGGHGGKGGMGDGGHGPSIKSPRQNGIKRLPPGIIPKYYSCGVEL